MAINIIPAEKSGLSSVDFDNLEFGKTFVDYMVVADYDGENWSDFEIRPLEKLSMHPGTSALHYGQCIFEGLKAYKTSAGDINLFRLTDNIKRINKSAVRMEMPELPEAETKEPKEDVPPEPPGVVPGKATPLLPPAPTVTV